MAFDALTGDAPEVWRQVKDPKTHVDIWLTCATMGAMLGAVPTVIQGGRTAQYYRYKHAADSADKVAGFRMTREKWEPIRDAVDGTDNAHMADAVMAGIIGNSELNGREKEAALGYVRNLMRMRGYNLAEAGNAGEAADDANAGVTEADVDSRIAAVAGGAAASGKGKKNEGQSLSLSPTDGDPDVPPAAAGNPHVNSGAQGAAPRGAKLEDLQGTSKMFSKKIADFITYGDWSGITADNFTKEIVSSLGMSNPAGQRSDYIDYSVDGDRITLRLSDHHGNARNIILKGRRSDKGISLVVLNGTSNRDVRFKGNGWADVVEYTYDNPGPESLKKIAKGLFQAFESGSYVDFTGKAAVDSTGRRRDAENAAYGEGYNTVDSAGMNGVRDRLVASQRRLDAIFGEHTDARQILEAENADGTPYFTAADRAAAQAAEEARREYEGMLQRVRDGIDDEVRQTEVLYDQRTNPQTGMIQQATLRVQNPDGTDRVVYVTGGNVVMSGDGQGVDREKSDASVVVVGEDGKVEMVSPEEISGLGTPIAGGQAKSEAVEALRQRLAQEAADKIDGNAVNAPVDAQAREGRPAQPARGYAAGESVMVRGDGGDAVEAQILDVSPDGIVIRTDSPVNGRAGSQQVSAEQLDGMTVQAEPKQTATSAVWGKVYQWTTNRVAQALGFLTSQRSGLLQGVFHRDEIGDIGIGWGNDKRGLAHIIKRHINETGDFKDVDELGRVIKDVMDNGAVRKEGDTSYAIEKGNYRVVVVKDDDGNWVLSAYDYVSSPEEKQGRKNAAASVTPGQPVVGAGAVAPNSSVAKVGNNSEIGRAGVENPDGDPVAERAARIAADSEGNRDYDSADAVAAAYDILHRLFGGDAAQAVKWTAARESQAEAAAAKAEREYGRGVGGGASESRLRRLKAASEAAAARRRHWADIRAHVDIEERAASEAAEETERFLASEAAAIDREAAAGDGAQESLDDYIRRKVVRAGIDPESFRRETGYGKRDQRSLPVGMLRKGGKSIERLAEELAIGYAAENGREGVLPTDLPEDANDMAVRNRILEIIQSGDFGRKALADAEARRREEAVERLEQQREEYYHSAYGVGFEEYADMREDAIRRAITEYDAQGDPEYYANLAALAESWETRRRGEEEPQNERGYGREEHAAEGGVPEADAGGDRVLPASRPAGRGGEGASPEREQSGEVPAGRGGAAADAAVPEGTPGEAAGQGGRGDTPGRQPGGLAEAGITAPLSDELNEFGKPFALSSDGTTTFGEVTAESGLKAAPIKLSVGENGVDNNGVNRGYGILHIEASHGKQIRAAGFSSIEEFVENVARNYDTIKEGGVVAGNQTYLLEVSDGHNNTLFVELSRDGGYWNVNSAGIFRQAYSRRKPVVASLPTIGNSSSTKAVEVNRGNTEGATTTSGNSSATSTGKVSEKSSAGKGKREKVAAPIGATSPQEQVEAQRQAVDAAPTEGQKEAGNYRKGHIKVDGYDITIENPRGSVRSGNDASGKAWSVRMHYDYGYILGTEGVDGDHIDVYLSDSPASGNVYVVDQIDQQDGSFDEHKVMYGFPSMEAAIDAYKSQYEDGWKVGTVTEVSREDFKKWVESSTRKTKPFAEYKANEGKPKQEGEAPAQQERTQPQADSRQTAGQQGYTIEPHQYTTKRGKVLDMRLVKFDHDLSQEEKDAVRDIVKEDKGWWSRDDGGYLMRSDEAVQRVADAISQTETPAQQSAQAGAEPMRTERAAEGVAEEKPSLLDAVRDLYHKGKEYASKLYSWKFFDVAKTPEFMKQLGLTGDKFTIRYGVIARHLGKDGSHGLTEKEWEQLPKALETPFAISKLSDKEAGYRIYTTLQTPKGEYVVVGVDVKNAGRDLEVNAISTVFGRRENANLPLNEEVIYRSETITPEQKALLNEPNSRQYPSIQELSATKVGDNSGTSANNSEKVSEAVGGHDAPGAGNYAAEAEPQPKKQEPKKNEGQFGLVSDERMEELKKRLRAKLNNLNMGVDPEVLAIGLELTAGYIDRGVKKFADYGKAMIADLGDAVRPYLKAFYNGVRDMPEITSNGLDAEMDDYETVSKFNVATIGKEGENTHPSILDTAEQISNEQTVQRQAAPLVQAAQETGHLVVGGVPKAEGSKSVFGKVYDQFKGKPKRAYRELSKEKGGIAIGVYHRDDIGDIALVWGDERGGLVHIIKRHIEEQTDFPDIESALNVMQQVIDNGNITRENPDKVVIDYNGYRVVVRKQTRDNQGNVVESGNWVVTAFDKSRSEKEKTPSRGTLTTPPSNREADGVTLPSNGVSNGKVGEKTETRQGKGKKKVATSQSKEQPSLFDGISGNDNNNSKAKDNDLRRIDELRPEGLQTDRDNEGEHTSGQGKAAQERREGPDGEGTEGSLRQVRRRPIRTRYWERRYAPARYPTVPARLFQ